MKYLILIALGFLFTAGVYAENETVESYRDPFESVLPEDNVIGPGGPPSEEAIIPPSITVEGIIWGVATPQAIIDGEVYKEGDTLKSVDAKIFRIQKSVVSLQYKGKIFETGIQKGTTEEKEAQ